jgi:hypothetical protein
MSKFYTRVLQGCQVDHRSNPIGCASRTYYDLTADTSDAPASSKGRLTWLLSEAKRACRDGCGRLTTVTAYPNSDKKGSFITSQCNSSTSGGGPGSGVPDSGNLP